MSQNTRNFFDLGDWTITLVPPQRGWHKDWRYLLHNKHTHASFSGEHARRKVALERAMVHLDLLLTQDRRPDLTNFHTYEIFWVRIREANPRYDLKINTSALRTAQELIQAVLLSLSLEAKRFVTDKDPANYVLAWDTGKSYFLRPEDLIGMYHFYTLVHKDTL